MKIEGPAKQIRIYIGESDQWHGQPLSSAIVRRAREAGLAGATVLRGEEGYGAHSRIHTERILRLSEDLPVVIDIIDREDTSPPSSPSSTTWSAKGWWWCRMC